MNQVSLDRGWGVESVRHVNEDDDPMLQQMDIIRNYIRQARREHRYDEVAILEENLRELQAEHERMKAEQQPIHWRKKFVLLYQSIIAKFEFEFWNCGAKVGPNKEM